MFQNFPLSEIWCWNEHWPDFPLNSLYLVSSVGALCRGDPIIGYHKCANVALRSIWPRHVCSWPWLRLATGTLFAFPPGCSFVFSSLVLLPLASSSSLWFLGSCYCEDSVAPICFQHMGPRLLLPKSSCLLFRAGWVVVWKGGKNLQHGLYCLYCRGKQMISLSLHPFIHPSVYPTIYPTM